MEQIEKKSWFSFQLCLNVVFIVAIFLQFTSLTSLSRFSSEHICDLQERQFGYQDQTGSSLCKLMDRVEALEKDLNEFRGLTRAYQEVVHDDNTEVFKSHNKRTDSIIDKLNEVIETQALMIPLHNRMIKERTWNEGR